MNLQASEIWFPSEIVSLGLCKGEQQRPGAVTARSAAASQQNPSRAGKMLGIFPASAWEPPSPAGSCNISRKGNAEAAAR